jgi:hypothetical protein
MDRLEAGLNGDAWKRNGPQYLGEQDIGSFDTATRARKPIRNQEDIWDYLKTKNPVRVHRMRKDYRWMQRQIKKIGLSPEDAREMF